MITAVPNLIARLGPLIGGGIMASDPNKIQQLLQTFSSSPLAQILRAKNGEDEKDEKSLEELAEDIEEKAKDIAKDMVGGYDDAVLGNDEIMSEIMNREDVKEQIKKDREDREPNAMGGMIDKAISYGPRN